MVAERRLKWRCVIEKDLEGYVARLTALGGGSGDSKHIYEDWALTYEENLQDDYGYVAPNIAADVFAEHCSVRDLRILDLGCGTGLVGKELNARGFCTIDGLDYSPGMLAEAEKKEIYGNLIVGDMTQPLELIGPCYDAAIAVGCFGGGHLGPQHLEGIIRSVTINGLLVLYINGIPYDQDDYPAHFRALEVAGVWQMKMTKQSNYMQALNRSGWVVVAHRS